MTVRKFLIEGLDRLGKDTLIDGLLHERGYHQVLHFSKPKALDCYGGDLQEYQARSFRTMFRLLESDAHIICNRAHLGEYVYSPLYRGYDGQYVFDMEHEKFANLMFDVQLVLLTEDFSRSNHFVDDGESFDAARRVVEQKEFIRAFNWSCLPRKRLVCVTAEDGSFRPKAEILQEVLHGAAR